MNILLVTPWRPSVTGGISTVISRLTEEFQRKGNRVAVFVTDHDNIVRQLEILHGAPVYGMYLRSPASTRSPIWASLKAWLYLPVTMTQLFWLTKRLAVDAIIIQYPLPNMFYFGLLKRWVGAVLLVTYQGNDAHDLSEWEPRARGLVGSLLQSADAVLGVSRTLLGKVQQTFPWLQSKRLQLLPNGAPLDLVAKVEPATAERGDRPGYVFTAGHLIPRKGVDTVISALKIAKDEGVILQLMIAGDGPERNKLIRQAQEESVADQVRFVGNQSQIDVLRLMKASLFFVLASRAEGMPLVIAEAMACGKAVVATRVDGVPEIVQDGSTGVLVPVDDPQALAKALMRMATDSVYREELAKRGKEWALREYNWESIANRYLGVIQECQMARKSQDSSGSRRHRGSPPKGGE